MSADTRFYDALTLASAGAEREAGAIYLFGYVSEMLLKAAYCQFTGLAATDPVYPVLKSIGAATHDLSKLADLVIDTRAAAGSPMDAAVAAQMKLNVAAIETHREVTMRYFSVAATPDEVEEVYQSIDWLIRNYDRLWS